MVTELTQWSTIAPFGAKPVSWVPGEDQERINSYTIYESIYWNVPDSFKIVQRGSDSKPIYIPAARQIIETMHRYLCPGFDIGCDPFLGTPEQRAEAVAVLQPFMRRERVKSKVSTNKRYGLIRGDAIFHITADETLEEGARISLEIIDPASYFPIYHEDGLTIIGVHLVNPMEDDEGNQVILRQTYRKVTGLGGPSPITVEEAFYEVDKWGGPDMEEVSIRVVRPPEQLPDLIQHIPVYRVPNTEEPGAVFGSSELRGIERVLTAINQSISDEELELVLNGLGVYATDAGAPIDEDTGDPIPWNLGPAKVVELPEGKQFKRVSGTTSVEPHQSHLKYLHDQLDTTMGMSDVSKGTADVNTAESGIALEIRLAPIFARADEKQLIWVDVITQMLFDLKQWFIAFESINIGDCVWVPTFGDRLPPNKAAKVKEILAIAAVTPPIVSRAWVRKELAKLGYEFGDTDDAMLAEIIAELQAYAQVESDVTGSRIDSELNNGDGSTDA